MKRHLADLLWLAGIAAAFAVLVPYEVARALLRQKES